MRVIAQNAEQIFIQELKSCRTNNSAERCLYFRLSQLEQDRPGAVADFVKATQEFFDDPQGQIFICADNDVFVLTRFINLRNFSEFFAHLTVKLRSAPVPEGLADLFEVLIDGDRLQTIAEHKIDVIAAELKKRAEAEAKQRAETYRRRLLAARASGPAIETLPERRKNRKDPEVMVVEDDVFTQRLVKNVLDKKYNVSTAGDGREAVSSYASKAPDVLFLDIGLPDITGHDVLQKIFEIDPEAFVVMLSGNGDRENILKAIERGAKGFVGKPFTKEKLLQYIEKSPFIQAKQFKETEHGNPIH